MEIIVKDHIYLDYLGPFIHIHKIQTHPENTYQDRRFPAQLSPNSLTDYFPTAVYSKN